MKTAADFKRALGDPTPEFEGAIRQTLSVLTEKEARPMKKRLLYALVPALLVICLTAWAAGGGDLLIHQDQVLPIIDDPFQNAANITPNDLHDGWGILDFMDWWMWEPLPEGK